MASYPIFFSVSANDAGFAESVWDKLPDDWVYLYSKTGEVFVDMWDEISAKELPNAKILVVFWSRNFIESKGCVREILQARELMRDKLILPLILRLDDLPLHWTNEFSEEKKEVFFAIGEALDYRTSHVNVQVDHAREMILRVAEQLLVSNHPRLPRPDYLQSIRKSLQSPDSRFKFLPAAWISGFNGVGRETIVREYNRDFAPNGRGVTLEVNEATLPRQLLLRLHSEGLNASRQRLEELQNKHLDDEPRAVAEAIEQIFNSGNYVILRHARIIEERVELPAWIDNVVSELEPATRSKLFIISQMPYSISRRAGCQGKIETQRIPTLSDYLLESYCYQLVGHFDPQPERWTEDIIRQVVAAAGGTVGFLITLVRAASRLQDLDQLSSLTAAAGAPIIQQVTFYSRWAFAQLAAFPDEQRTLVFLNDVSPCDIEDLNHVIKPTRSMLQVLGKLLDLGLVERESDNVYRLTPLLANRLSRDLLRPDLLSWHRAAMIEFVKQPPNFETSDHEFIRIESRIQAALLEGSDALPKQVSQFVSASHWFQAGIRLYHANRRDPAYRLLKKVFDKRSEFPHSTRVEIIRYFCLSATRAGKYPESEACISLLNNDHRTKPMSAFLQGNLLEAKYQFSAAIEWYEEALAANQSKNSRLEHTYRPLISCILKTSKPDFMKAERYALRYVGLRRSVFSLMALARVYLHWIHEGEKVGCDMSRNLKELYQNALRDLASDPGAGGSHFEVRAEEAEYERNFTGALEYMDLAIESDPRPELRHERWKLMMRKGDLGILEQAIKEMDHAKLDHDFVSNWNVLVRGLAETYCRLLKLTGKPLVLLNRFASGMPDSEIARIITQSKRGG